MRKKIIAGNWKMNGSLSSIRTLLDCISQDLPSKSHVQCIVFPPSIYLPLASQLLQSKKIFYGAQNVYFEDKGAYTGEISGPMLKDFHCTHVLIGHSERRVLFAENEKIVAKKFHHVKDHDMMPLLCVGESLEERENGLTEQVLIRQLNAIAETNPNSFSNCIIAYEPVWAIGTGLSASPEQAQEAHNWIRKIISSFNKEHAECLSILYGGSVTEKNAKALFAMPDIDGGLIGGASLQALQFVEIFKCIN
jgi:triosephosphate isomerase